MKIGTVASATAEVPVKVSFRCSHCGYENKNLRSTVKLASYARGYGNTTDKALQSIARSGAATQYQQFVEDVAQKTYKGEGLICKCNKCGKQESWSKANDKTPNIAFIVCLLIGCFVGIILAVNLGADETMGVIIVLVGLLVWFASSILFIRLRAKHYKKLISEMKPDDYPTVEINL